MQISNGYSKLDAKELFKSLIFIISYKFNISNNKTKNPPDISKYEITEDQLISLIIGFIDGDGSIYVPSYTEKLRIECHKNWYDNLLFFENCLLL